MKVTQTSKTFLFLKKKNLLPKVTIRCGISITSNDGLVRYLQEGMTEDDMVFYTLLGFDGLINY